MQSNRSKRLIWLAGSIGVLLATAGLLALGLWHRTDDASHRMREVGRAAQARSLPPGEYSYKEALAAGLTTKAQWARPPGMRRCPPIPDPYPSVSRKTPIRSGAPTCYMPPEEQGLVFIVEPYSAATRYDGGNWFGPGY